MVSMVVSSRFVSYGENSDRVSSRNMCLGPVVSIVVFLGLLVN